MEKLNLAKPLIKICNKLKIKEPTEIQVSTIPRILNNENILGVSATGSGKTACFCLPILQKLSSDPYGIYCVVVLPTKELAIQVKEQFQLFATPLNIQDEVALIIGGQDWLSQAQTINKKPFIVIGTPGRLLSHIESDFQHFKDISCLVLDESDKLLSGNLFEKAQALLNKLTNDSINQQILFFTATLTDELTGYLNDYFKGRSKKFDIVNLNCEVKIPEKCEHFYLFIPAHVKLYYLVYAFKTDFVNQSAMIFTKTCQTAQLLTTTLQLLEFPVTCLHSLLDISRRSAHLAKFKSSQATILVATDVASRGLDIPKTNVVVNYDFPLVYTDYVHRAGRTARVKRAGVVLNLICEFDKQETILLVEKHLNEKFELFSVDEDAVSQSMSYIAKKQHEAEQILYEDGFYDKVKKMKRNKLSKSKKNQTKKQET